MYSIKKTKSSFWKDSVDIFVFVRVCEWILCWILIYVPFPFVFFPLVPTYNVLVGTSTHGLSIFERVPNRFFCTVWESVFKNVVLYVNFVLGFVFSKRTLKKCILKFSTTETCPSQNIPSDEIVKLSMKVVTFS